MITIAQLKELYPKIHQPIIEYYPIGTSNINPEYLGSFQSRNLARLINENIFNPKKYSQFWTKGIVSEIQKEIGYEVYDITYGCIPNFGGMIQIVEEKIEENLWNIAEIQFYVSLIKNYVSIQIAEIQERMTICEITSQELMHRNLKKLTVSPHPGKYNAMYLKIETILKRCLKQATFIPYSVDETLIEGLSVTHKNDLNCSIGDAFFRKILPSNTPEVILGDVNYSIANL